MSKWYEVTATIIKTFAVEVEDDENHEDAMQIASEEISLFEGDVDLQCPETPIARDQVELLKKTAEEVLKL